MTAPTFDTTGQEIESRSDFRPSPMEPLRENAASSGNGWSTKTGLESGLSTRRGKDPVQHGEQSPPRWSHKDAAGRNARASNPGRGTKRGVLDHRGPTATARTKC